MERGWVWGHEIASNDADDDDRAGFYAENLLLYSEQAKNEGVLPLPIGEGHKFAPVALGVSPIIASGNLFGDQADMSRISHMWLRTSCLAKAPMGSTTDIAAR